MSDTDTQSSSGDTGTPGGVAGVRVLHADDRCDLRRAGAAAGDDFSATDLAILRALRQFIRQPERSDVSARPDRGGDGDQHQPGPDPNLDPGGDCAADSGHRHDLLWDQLPYWTVVPVATADPAPADPTAPVRQPDAGRGVHLDGEPDRDTNNNRDHYGRERDLTC